MSRRVRLSTARTRGVPEVQRGERILGEWEEKGRESTARLNFDISNIYLSEVWMVERGVVTVARARLPHTGLNSTSPTASGIAAAAAVFVTSERD